MTDTAKHEQAAAKLGIGLDTFTSLVGDIGPALDGITKVVDFIDQYSNLPLLSSIHGPVDLVDKVLHALDALAHEVSS